MSRKKYYSSKYLTFGQMLIKYRHIRSHSHKLTQKAVADICNIPYSSYRKYEQGVSFPKDTNRIFVLGKFLNIPPHELLSTAFPEYSDYFTQPSSASFPLDFSKIANEDFIKSVSLDIYEIDVQQLAHYFRIFISFLSYMQKQ